MFNWAVLGWLLSGMLIMSVSLFIERDEADAKAQLMRSRSPGGNSHSESPHKQHDTDPTLKSST